MTRLVRLANVNHPGKTYEADGAKYAAMKGAFLKVLPRRAPGLTVAELERRVVRHLSQALFPNGEKAGWWTKAVQLDLEARELIVREPVRPLRLHRT